jgi:hypothetical protein
MRTVTTSIDNILSLIACAEDYGFERTILFYAFAEMLGTLSDEEIAEHVAGYGEDYEDEDRKIIKTKLEEFRERYMK